MSNIINFKNSKFLKGLGLKNPEFNNLLISEIPNPRIFTVLILLKTLNCKETAKPRDH